VVLMRHCAVGGEHWVGDSHGSKHDEAVPRHPNITRSSTLR